MSHPPGGMVTTLNGRKLALYLKMPMGDARGMYSLIFLMSHPPGGMVTTLNGRKLALYLKILKGDARGKYSLIFSSDSFGSF